MCSGASISPVVRSFEGFDLTDSPAWLAIADLELLLKGTTLALDSASTLQTYTTIGIQSNSKFNL